MEPERGVPGDERERIVEKELREELRRARPGVQLRRDR